MATSLCSASPLPLQDPCSLGGPGGEGRGLEGYFFPSLSSAPGKQPSPSGGHTALPLPVLLPSGWAAARGAAGHGRREGDGAQIRCGFCAGVTCPLLRAAARSAAPSGGVGRKKRKKKKKKRKVYFLTTFVRFGSSRLLLTTKDSRRRRLAPVRRAEDERSSRDSQG